MAWCLQITPCHFGRKGPRCHVEACEPLIKKVSFFAITNSPYMERKNVHFGDRSTLYYRWIVPVAPDLSLSMLFGTEEGSREVVSLRGNQSPSSRVTSPLTRDGLLSPISSWQLPAITTSSFNPLLLMYLHMRCHSLSPDSCGTQIRYYSKKLTRGRPLIKTAHGLGTRSEIYSTLTLSTAFAHVDSRPRNLTVSLGQIS